MFNTRHRYPPIDCIMNPYKTAADPVIRSSLRTLASHARQSSGFDITLNEGGFLREELAD